MKVDPPPKAAPAEAPHRAVAVEAIAGKLRTRVEYLGNNWELAAGGDAAPDPVSAFLAALGSCLLMSLKIAADARRIRLGRCAVAARSNERGPVREIALELKVECGADDAGLRRLAEVAERGCYVRGVLRKDLPLHLSVTRIAGPGSGTILT